MFNGMFSTCDGICSTNDSYVDVPLDLPHKDVTGWVGLADAKKTNANFAKLSNSSKGGKGRYWS
jgi:hypothetical protein